MAQLSPNSHPFQGGNFNRRAEKLLFHPNYTSPFPVVLSAPCEAAVPGSARTSALHPSRLASPGGPGLSRPGLHPSSVCTRDAPTGEGCGMSPPGDKPTALGAASPASTGLAKPGVPRRPPRALEGGRRHGRTPRSAHARGPPRARRNPALPRRAGGATADALGPSSPLA